MKIHPAHWLLFLLLFLSCNFFARLPQDTPTLIPPSPTIMDSPSKPESTPSQTPQVPTPTPLQPLPTTTSTDPTCVRPQGDPVFQPVKTFQEYAPAVLEFLNQGATRLQLDEALYERGVGNLPVIVDSGDMTGNGKDDFVIALFDPESSGLIPAGSLLIYVCEEDMFTLRYMEDSQESYGAPHLWYLQDLDADQQEELVVSEPLCGVSACFEAVRIVAWNGVNFENQLSGISDDLPFPDIRVRDEDEDGLFDLEVVGSGFGSAGAGPAREKTRTWVFNAGLDLWQVSGDTLGPSNYRIHALSDADTAAKQGDFSEAILLYQRVIRDMTLQDWQDPQQERTNLAAYARYKLVVVYTFMDQLDFAQTLFEELSDEYLPESPQYGFVEIAQVFREGYASGGQEAGCEAARAYAVDHPVEVLEPLGVKVFGYGNREYTPEDVCP